MNNKGEVSVLGCGWLGLPLAKSLVQQGYTVKGSTTTPAKIDLLREADIDPYLIHFNNSVDAALPDIFFDAEVLIVASPPGRTDERRADYQLMTANIIARVQQKPALKKIIWISSTSVYGDLNKELNEYDKPRPQTKSGKLLLDVENQLVELKDKQVAIVRFGGLVGPQRHPGRFFKGKTDLPNGLAPINMIHLYDAIGIIKALLIAEKASGVYNGCSPDHPPKQDFYALAAKKAGIAIPSFIPEKKEWKLVDSVRLAIALNYQFLQPDLMAWIRSEPLTENR